MPISFWANGVSLNFGLTYALMAIPWGELTPKSPKVFSVVIVLLWPLGGAIAVWQLVGIWRSATSYVQAGKSKIWGGLAKAAIVLSFTLTALQMFYIGFPQAAHFARIALGDDPFGTYKLTLLNGNTELEINGVITFGLTDEALRSLDANPTIHVIRLNSKGGRMGEARRLRDLIESKGLTTSTTTSCLSACTFAYLAGKQRLIGKGAQLGFHEYVFPGAQGKDLRPQIEKDKADWVGRGVKRSFVDRAFATPNNQMWLPTQQELRDSGVITGRLTD